MSEANIAEVADNTYLVTGTHVNWVVLTEGQDITLIDGGYPGDSGRLIGSLARLGYRPQNIRAILVTHAHVDHVGGLPALRTQHRAPVYLDPTEVAHIRREYLEQCRPVTVAANLWRPGMLGWAARIATVGAARDIRIADAEPFPRAGALDLPGAPVPVATAGHTSGHTAYFLPAVGAVVTGDTLVSAHPTSRSAGPQVLAPMFNHHPDQLGQALDALSGLDADTILPGHGPVYRGPISEAVAAARPA